MKKELFGAAECRGNLLTYYLLQENGQYGIGVKYREEEVLLPCLGTVRVGVENLLSAMLRGCVTPVTAGDVAEDWLLAGNP